ncbi:unnamed protein product [Citrullus colocynthis]|uniref:Uncharacterized protein n=1 Tax=Citrullus colocynthis TaxID=252529 RepID=A0ABP0XZA2_9ROSI
MLTFREQINPTKKVQHIRRRHNSKVETFTVESHSYANAISSNEGSLDESESTNLPLSSIVIQSIFNWDKMIILTQRCLYDDRVRIIKALRESNEAIDYFHPFHADKAVLTIKDLEQARLLCLNRRWVTISCPKMKPSNSAASLLSAYLLLLLFLSLVTFPLSATGYSVDASPSPPPPEDIQKRLRHQLYVRYSRAILSMSPWPNGVVVPSPPPPFR